MYEDNESLYYLVGNENYMHPAMPKGCEDGIIKGL